MRCFAWAIAILAMIGCGPLAAVARMTRVASPVRLEAPARKPADGLDRMPKVVPNAAVGAAAAARINAALGREDARAVAAARDCRREAGSGRSKDDPPAWTRSVAVTMAGPRYLAYQVSDSYYCGGAYPSDGIRSDFVYDLATGAPVDWLRLFPAGARAKLSDSASGARLGLVVWSELTRRAAADAQADCREAFAQEDYAGFTIGLDARAGVLTALPAEFPHVIQACADEIRFDPAMLRKLGFAPQLADAIAAARR